MKNNLKNIVFTIVLLLCITNARAQETTIDITELFKKSQAHFTKHEAFKMDMEYTLYRNKKKPVIIDSYKGELIKEHNDTYIKIHNTEMLTSNNSFIKINHKQKAIEFSTVENNQTIENPAFIEQYLKHFQTKKINVTGNTIICVLTAPKYTQLSYGSVVLVFDKDTYQLQKQTLELVMPGRIKDEKGNLNNTRKYLDIIIEKIEQNPSRKNELKLINYVTLNGKTVKPNEKYANYKFINRNTNE